MKTRPGGGNPCKRFRLQPPVASTVRLRTSVKSKVTGINRFIALLLAIVWLCAGIAGMFLAFVHGHFLLAFLALFALVYAMLWLRVFARARLVRLSELALPRRIR